MPQGEYLPEGRRLESPRNQNYTSSHAGMARAMADGAVLEGMAVACEPGRELTVQLGAGLWGTIPREEGALGINTGRVREIALLSRVGRPVCFHVIDRMGDRYILSRRSAQQAALDWLLEELAPGEVIDCTVTHLEPFGAFVDMGCGLPSLIGIENISVSRIAHSRDRFAPGQQIHAAVLEVDRRLERVTLTHRELLGTWKENLEGITAGQTRVGIVRGVPDYGVFVELTPNLSGLAEAKAGLAVGDGVSVYVKSILPDRMKVKLIVIDRLEHRRRRLVTPDDYYIRSGRIGRWVYSPPECRGKYVATHFA